MKFLASVLTLLLTSSSASAAVQFSFAGQFGESPSTIPSGAITLEALTGSSFAGQFNFNAANPDQNGYQTQTAPGGLVIDNATSYLYQFNQHQSASVSINGAQSLLSSAPIDVRIIDNSERFKSGPIDNQNGNVIGGSYYTSTAAAIVQSSIYDVVSIETMQTTPSSKPVKIISDLIGGFPGIELLPPHDTIAIAVSALFAADTFSLDGVNAPNPQTILNLSKLKFLVFQFDLFDVTNDRFMSGAGLLESYSLTEVPVPGAVWLFGSVLLGWQLGRRKPA